jgi:hypothetical protein
MSLVSLDLNANAYKFIGNSFIVPNENGKNRIAEINDVSRLSDHLISVEVKKIDGNTIYLYNLNQNYTEIEFMKSVEVAKDARWFNQIGATIFYARCNLRLSSLPLGDSKYKLYYFIYGISKLNLDGSVEPLPNTGTRSEFMTNCGGWTTVGFLNF